MPSIRATVFGRLNTRAKAYAVALGLLILPAVAAAQASRPCLTPDSISASVMHLGVTLVSDTSARVVSLRSKYSIPSGAASDVVVVQDHAVCEALTAAMDSVATPSPVAYHVIRIGTVAPVYLLAKPDSSGLPDGVFLLNAQHALVAVFH